MAVKPGYKQTEVGVIPEDWQTPELGSILKSMQLGGNYKNGERETNWPLIKMGNMGRGTINLDKLEYIDSRQPPATRDRLKEDDVLFNTRNTLELVGKIAIWRKELPEAYFNSNIMRMGFVEAQVSSNRFMNYILNTPQTLKSLRAIAIGTTSVAAIYGRDLIKVKVALPTKAEQEAIAEALTDSDALIESLEQLIAKKRQIKHGAMQELLTGKRRLPGFSGEWEVRRLGEILSRVANGAVYKPTNSLGYQMTRIETIADGTIDYSRTGTAEPSQDLEDYKMVTGDILFSHINSLDHIGKVAQFLGGQDLYHGMNLLLLRANREADSRFLYFWLTSVSARRKARSLAKQAVSQASINTTEMKALEILCPPLAEQEAIATILSDMDAEFTALEAKLTKARQLKQGMMQELLTGRIRLV